MYYLQHLIIALSPKTIKCVEPTGQEEISFEEQNQHSPYAIITSKVPTFQSLLNPIRMICSRHEHIRGFKFDINMPLSPYFQTGHSWNIPSSGMSKNPMKPNQPTYTFNSQLVRDIQQGQPQTILTARIDNQGKLQAFFIKKLMPNLTMRINAMYMNSNIQNGMVGADFDYETKNNNFGVKFANGVFNLAYMQRISSNLILGFDFNHLAQQSMSLYGYAAKFNYHRHNFFFQYLASQGSSNLAYSIPLKKGTTFVTNFVHEIRQNKTKTVVGVRQKYNYSEIIATINSKGKIATSLTVNGSPQTPYSLKLCAIVNYLKDTYKFGYGITIGQIQ